MRNTNFQNVVDVLHLSIVAKETYLSIEVMEIYTILAIVD